jgi:bifunctional enzyme CysN/CysC
MAKPEFQLHMPERDLLRFLTAGSVDDGKSTLIGRLLHDSNALYQDHLASVRSASANSAIDFSLFTDGLRAEREQGITIDVAYRYFATPKRKFILADTPGHEQYTRNMATGASNAELAVLLTDARKGLLPQTHRHAAIAWLLGIRSFVVAINKMDLAGFDENIFRAIEQDFRRFAVKFTGLDLCFIPTCSLDGDNVASLSTRTPWYRGPSLLEYLENVRVSSRGDRRLRFPVQNVLRADHEPRRYAGQVSSGVVRVGDPVVVLPSERATRIASIRIGDRELESAAPPLSVTISLADELDISRGDMLADPESKPTVARRFRATVLWMSESPLEIGRPYLIKHTTRQVCASVTQLNAVLDPATLDRQPASTLALNEFGECEIECHQPLYFDAYHENRLTGGFLIIDPIGNGTLAAGMISSALETGAATPQPGAGLTVWFTGLSSAGKSTIGKAVYEKLWARGYKVEWLDGDAVRQNLSKGLGFSKDDRDENVRRIGFVAELLTRNGVIALVSLISPYRGVREEVRRRIGNFLEVYVHAPLEICEQRDVKGLYRRARAGQIPAMTGIDDPYEPPLTPDLECRTDLETAAESTAKVLDAIERRFAKTTHYSAS